LIEIGAALFPGSRPAPHEVQVTARIALIAHVSPTPPPRTPPPPPRPKVIAKRRIVPHKIAPARSSRVSPIKRVAARPVELSQKAKSAAAGSVGNGGAGTGESGIGTGTGGAAPADEPCGEVDFIEDSGTPRYDAATGFYIYDDIALSVHYPDGSHQQVDLDYPWRYKDEAGDPFQHPDQPVLFEFPPPALRAAEPAPVQYVMAHTSRGGFTTLAPCPEPSGNGNSSR